jgi:hypothetical protein
VEPPIETPTPVLRSIAPRLLLVLALVALSWSGLIENSAEQQHQKMLTRALVTFGVARSLNGAISVIQETEVALQPAGVGVTLAPGQILDPVNDLIERFSWVMLASAASSGVQRLLLEISLWPWMTLVLAAAALGWLCAHAVPASRSTRLLARRLLLIAIFVRFAVPGVMLVNDLSYRIFLEPVYAEASAELTRTRDDLTRLQAQSDFDQGERSWLDRTADQIRIRERLESYQALFSRLAEDVVNLVAVFVLQTILLPLLFLWALVRLWTSLWGRTMNAG